MFVLAQRLLPAIFIMILSTGVLAGESAVLTSNCTTPKEGDVTLKCLYTVDFAGLKKEQQLDVALQIPQGVDPLESADLGDSAVLDGQPMRRDRHIVYKFKIQKPSGKIKFTSESPVENYEVKKKSYYMEPELCTDSA